LFTALQVLGLVDENFAAGVLYGIDNVYNETYNVIVYNMGATSTQVSVHTHDSYIVKEVRGRRESTFHHTAYRRSVFASDCFP
jgi:molecular chaperone DnaK (HSP70)